MKIGKPYKYPITIFVPVFNKLKYLPICLHCCLNQTYPHYEIVFVDDCSKDTSFVFLETETKNDKRVTIVRHLYNKGTFHSRRTGVLYSNGKYILSYDPDDFLSPTIIQDLLEFIYNGNRESANEHEINSDTFKKFDVLEFRMRAKFGNKIYHNFKKCNKDFFNNSYGLYYSFSEGNLGNNVLKRLIKRKIYFNALQILLPFMRDKKICSAEDQIIISVVFALTNRYICTQILGYYYFFHKKDNSLSGKYQNKKQIEMQNKFGKEFVYFGKSRTKDFVDISKKEIFLIENFNNMSNKNLLSKENIWKYITNKSSDAFFRLDGKIRSDQENMKDLWDKIDVLENRTRKIKCAGSDQYRVYIIDEKEENCIIRQKDLIV